MDKPLDYKIWRITHGFKLQEIAKEIGVNISTISRFENERVNTNRYIIERYDNFIAAHTTLGV